MQKYTDTLLAQSAGGVLTPMASATVTVTLAAGGAATIYSDNGVTPLANPFTSDSVGRLSFYAADGRYTVTVSKTEYTTVVVTDILLEDPANASAVVISGGTINATPIGATTPSTGAFTTLSASGVISAPSSVSLTNAGSPSQAYVGGNGSGRAIINAPTGQEVDLNINGTTVLYATATGVGTLQPLAVTGAISSTSDIQTNNATYIKGKLAAGGQTRLLGINASDVVYIGSIDATVGAITIVNNGQAQWTQSGIGRTWQLPGGADTTGTGIAFPATQVPSSDPNTLDDYEEGSFTPTVVGNTTVGSGTYTAQTGRYTKIGNLVTIRIYIIWSGHTGTGGMYIAGLPFTVAAFAACSVWNSGTAINANSTIQAYTNTGTTRINVEQAASATGVSTAVSMTASGTLMINTSYEI